MPLQKKMVSLRIDGNFFSRYDMGRFINPFTDIGFKKLFGQKIHKYLLIDFLNQLLIGERRIVDLEYLDKEIVPEYKGDRSTIFDIYCKTDTGEYIIVEMQNQM